MSLVEHLVKEALKHPAIGLEEEVLREVITQLIEYNQQAILGINLTLMLCAFARDLDL
jgi:hypothetical protein